MPQFLAGPLLADIAIAFLVAEVLAIGGWRQAKRRPPRWLVLAASALPGVLLLLALRLALADAPLDYVALALAASLPAHWLDLRLRAP